MFMPSHNFFFFVRLWLMWSSSKNFYERISFKFKSNQFQIILLISLSELEIKLSFDDNLRIMLYTVKCKFYFSTIQYMSFCWVLLLCYTLLYSSQLWLNNIFCKKNKRKHRYIHKSVKNTNGIVVQNYSTIIIKHLANSKF